MSELKVNKLSPATGTETTLGDSSDDFLLPSGAEIIAQSGSTITIASGATIANAGTATGFGGVGITLGTEQATTSGSDFTFSGIPSGTKRVYMIFEEVVISGSDDWLIQLGDGGGIETSGYTSSSTSHTTANVIANATSTSGFVMDNNSGSSSTLTGAFCFELTDSTNNTWIGHSVLESYTNQTITSGGSKSLSAAITQIKLDTTGSNTFTAGSINITYE